jgi:hypothetical protein
MKEQKSRITTAETNFLRKGAKCTLFDHNKNKVAIKELRTPKISIITNKSKQHVCRMHGIVRHQPAGKGNPGGRRKGFLDRYIETSKGQEA